MVCVDQSILGAFEALVKGQVGSQKPAPAEVFECCEHHISLEERVERVYERVFTKKKHCLNLLGFFVRNMTV